MTDFMQGALAEVSLSFFGMFWGAVFGPLSNGLAFMIQALSAPSAWRKRLMWLGVGMLSLPPEVVPEALLVNFANAAGVGEGKLQSDLSNLTALMKIAGPPILGQAYFVGMRRGFPGAWGAAALAAYWGGMISVLSVGAEALRC